LESQILGEGQNAGEKTVADNYWSGTTNVNNTTNAWNVNFYNGNVNNNNKTNNNYVRCVRGKLIFSLRDNQKFSICFSRLLKLNMSNSQHLPLYLKIYQLIKFLYERVRNFPKQYKYSLGQNILDLSWQCLDLVLEANILPNEKKHPKILELSIVFDKLKIRLRMAQELDLISKRQFVHIQIYYIKEIGEMVGGWLKWAS